MENVGLVLEGGAMRGIYTAGVLDFFLEKDLFFPYVVGVSAGACQAFSYISKQFGRSKKVSVDYIRNPRYLSFSNYLKEKSIFGMNFMFHEIPEKLIPFDYDTFHNSSQDMVVVATNCLTGEPVYFYKSKGADMFLTTQASISMPLISKEVYIDETPFLDGGLSDPIPILKSIKDGYRKNIIILTRHEDYRKEPIGKGMKWALKKKYPHYNAIFKAMETRHQVYNTSLDLIRKLENDGNAVVIRPSEPVKVKRTERNIAKLNDLYSIGYNDSKKYYEKIKTLVF